MERKPVNYDEFARFCARQADEKQADHVVTLKVKDLSSIADYFVICGATSQPHLKALANHLEEQAREHFNLRPLAVDGQPGSEWVLLDFGPVLIHLMTQSARDRYELERLWSDAPHLELSGEEAR